VSLTQTRQREGGVLGQGFCSAPHPDNPPLPGPDEYDKPDQTWAWCRRLPHAEGPHRAYTFSIKEPEEW
jgi:hypothetical protein